MKHKQWSIQWKVFSYLIGFCVLLLAVLWLFQIVLLDDFYKGIKIREIGREASAIADIFESGDWEALVEAARERDDLIIELWNVRTGVSIRSNNHPSGIQSRLTESYKWVLYQEIEEHDDFDIRRFFSSEDTRNQEESILFSRAVLVGGTRNLLMVSANISPVSATVQTLRIQLFYISGIMLLLSVGLAFLITRRVSRPIEQLTASAGELARGNTDVSFPSEGYREIAVLADTLTHAARELSRTEQLRRELIANVSHDLRTPLTLITGYGELIRDLPDENTAENMQVIIDESKRLTTLVTDLLDLSRLQSGTGSMHFTRFNLTQEIRGIIGRFAKLCEQEGYVILFQRDEDVWVEADPERIAQVAYNFLINAVTHTGDDKQVVVRQITEGDRVTVEVADTGPGIPPEQLSVIWDRYYKVDTEHKRAATGTGLGLSIVKSILEQHPGVEYGVRSQVGEGSVFWFSLERR